MESSLMREPGQPKSRKVFYAVIASVWAGVMLAATFLLDAPASLAFMLLVAAYIIVARSKS